MVEDSRGSKLRRKEGESSLRVRKESDESVSDFGQGREVFVSDGLLTTNFDSTFLETYAEQLWKTTLQ